jgi:hypothetical protein
VSGGGGLCSCAGVAEARIGFSDEVARWMNEGEWVGADSFTSSYMSRATYLQNYYASGASAVTIAAISISQYRTLCKKHPSVGYRCERSVACGLCVCAWAEEAISQTSCWGTRASVPHHASHCRCSVPRSDAPRTLSAAPHSSSASHPKERRSHGSRGFQK